MTLKGRFITNWKRDILAIPIDYRTNVRYNGQHTDLIHTPLAADGTEWHKYSGLNGFKNANQERQPWRSCAASLIQA